MRTETLAPSNVRYGAILPRQVSPSVPILTMDEIISEQQSRVDSLKADWRPGSAAKPGYHHERSVLDNLLYIRDHGPQRKEKKRKETTLNDIGDLLLDLTGYGSAIARLLPVPAVQAGGRLAGYGVSAARAFSRGDYLGAGRQIERGTRYYNRTYGSDKPTQQGNRARSYNRK